MLEPTLLIVITLLDYLVGWLIGRDVKVNAGA